MIDRFEIIGHDVPRPDAERILFCDGTDGRIFRPETDLELSHWRPNRTPAEYRAGTSTEICLRFLDHPRSGPWTAAVNNHVDVDGMLSVYTLTHSDHALRHRRTLIAAAEMGDFWGWGEAPAQRVFQGLTKLMRSGKPSREIYAEAFRRIPGLIDGDDPQTSEIDASLAPLRYALESEESGRIVRHPLSARFTQYVLPLAIAGNDDERAGYVPEFNELISDKAVLWPQVRARRDKERVCLVSTERPAGWFHDLCCPGYLWADTEGLWQVPGLTYHDGMSSYTFDHPQLITAFAELQRCETGQGRWCVGGADLPFGTELQRKFPVVGRFLDDQGKPTISRLSSEQAAATLDKIFD